MGAFLKILELISGQTMKNEDEIVVAVYCGEIRSKERVIHTVAGADVSKFDELRIVKFGDDEYNLLYMNKGTEVTDTCHPCLQEALEQANYEFDLNIDEWVFYS